MGRVAGRVVFAALFLAGGIGHFVAPEVYLRIMPPALPWPRALVLLSGAAEVLLGALLIVPSTQVGAAWGLIALLVAVFPANVFMWQHADRFGIPAGALLARLPLQGLLIAWAWAYTRRPRAASVRPPLDPPPGARAARGALLVLGLVGGLAGCDLGGPRLDRLPGGSMARARDPDGRPLTVFFSAGEETVPDGTQVRVVSDAEGTVHQVDRKVVVGFVEGPRQGYAAMMRRSDLAPDR